MKTNLITSFLALFLGLGMPFHMVLRAQPPEKEIHNTLTEAHTEVPGTHVRLIPPKGFTRSDMFDGFEYVDKQASIMVTELPAPFQTLRNGFGSEALMEKGMLLKRSYSLSVNGMAGELYVLTQPAHGTDYRKLVLMMGDETETVMVAANFPTAYKDSLELPVRESLLSVIYTPEDRLKAARAPAFHLDIPSSQFMLAHAMHGMYMYTPNGKLDPDNDALITVGSSLGQAAAIDTADYARQRLRRLPSGAELDIEREQPIRLDGLSGYEILAVQRDESRQPIQGIVQVMLFASDRYYIFVGMAEAQIPQMMKQYRRIFRSFRQQP